MRLCNGKYAEAIAALPGVQLQEERDSLVEGAEGPEGAEKIEFADLGVRLAILGNDGTLTPGDSFTPAMLGGTLPSVGDRMATLWPADDPDAEELYEVVARYYVGEFYGDNCWWLIVRPVAPSARDTGLFALARASSAETRRRKKLREARMNEDLEVAFALAHLERLSGADSKTAGDSKGKRRTAKHKTK